MLPMPQPIDDATPSSGGTLVSVDGRELPLRGAALEADARGGLARVVLEQRFHNPYAEPLAVTYTLPLPSDAAVSGFSFQVGERTVVGEVDRRAAARERFEEALVQGRSAALLEQDRSSLFTQQIGNIPPRTAVTARVVLDQRLVWLDEGAWEWRFPTVVAPRYLGGKGRVGDADRVSVDVADAPLPPRLTLGLTVRDRLAGNGVPASPSHALRCDTEDGVNLVALRAEGGVPLDRDVVVRWPVAEPKAGATLDTGRPAADREHAGAAYGLLTVVPPREENALAPLGRDLIVLIDTSGSMHGEPLAHARRVVSALIDSLTDRDRLEMIEFSTSPRRWKRSAVAATVRERRDALRWVGKLNAGGATEMRDGILEALRPLGAESQRQVILISDGLIGFEDEILAELQHRLPVGSRLHTVGVGSAVNRSLTGPAARAGGGVEVVIGIGEDPELAAHRIVARTRAPLVVDLELSGSALRGHAPARIPDLFAGAPVLVGLELRPEGGDLVVTGRTATGTWEQRLAVSPMAPGVGSQAAVTLFGREQVEDLELARAAGEAGVDESVERIGLQFQIATRLTSWVAVSDEPTVDPREPTRKERIPQALPYGMSVEGLGLRGAAAPMPAGAAYLMLSASPSQYVEAEEVLVDAMPRPVESSAGFQPPRKGRGKLLGGLADGVRELFEPRRKRTRALKPEGAPPASHAIAATAFRGRVTSRKDDGLVIEVDVAFDVLDWSLPATVLLYWDDGTQTKAAVDDQRSTRSGSVSRGAVIRLVLRLEGGVPPGTLRRVESEGGGTSPWSIDLG